MEAKKPSIMIISASSGSGHTRAAEALVETAKQDSRLADVQHVDALKYTNALFREFYATAYKEIVLHTPTLWGWWYETSDEPWKTDKWRYLFERLNMQPFIDLLDEAQPDITICTHFLASEIVSHLMADHRINTRLAVVTTDYHIHAMWLCRTFNHFFVPAEEARQHLAALGFPADHVTVSGIPVMQDFRPDYDKAALRTKHGLKPDLPVILVSAGTFGKESAINVIEALQYLQTPSQTVVICGRNEELLADVNAMANQASKKNTTIHPVGYTNEMHEWMGMADLFIGKPGGLTVSECMASNLPMILHDPIPGQEVYNSAFLLENGAAMAPSSLLTLPWKIDALFATPEKLSSMRQAMQQLAHPEAAATIIDTMIAGLTRTGEYA
jgi:processive 1,2-diacylglycerol beta-glucosyltransferase